MIFLLICLGVLYFFLTSFGLVAVLGFCLLVYLIDFIFKRINKKLDKKVDEEFEEGLDDYEDEEPQKKVVQKQFKVIDLDTNKIICSYEYKADAIVKIRELRQQKRNVMIKIK